MKPPDYHPAAAFICVGQANLEGMVFAAEGLCPKELDVLSSRAIKGDPWGGCVKRDLGFWGPPF